MVWDGFDPKSTWAYDSTEVAYSDLSNPVYHRAMRFLYTGLECCSNVEKVGDLVEALLGIAYYMRFCKNSDGRYYPLI